MPENQPTGTPAPPPTADAGALVFVLGAYGATMMQVQAFEAMLATFVGVVETDPSDATPTTLERAMGRVVKRDYHLLQKASASEMRNRLRGKVDEDLLADISVSIGWRDFLAHRYLRVRLFPQGSAEPRVDPSLALELQELGQAFFGLSARIRDEMSAVLATWPPKAKETPTGIRHIMEKMARSLATVQPQRFSRTAPISPPRGEDELEAGDD